MTRTLSYMTAAVAALAFSLNARAEQAGKWTIYKSFDNLTEIAPAGTTAFALASGGLFSYDTATGETAVYDKTNCLSDASITHIRWASYAKRLVIAYDNSNIDIMTADGNVTNVPDLYMSTTPLDKTVNHIYADGTYAYLALGLGVAKLDLRQGIVSDTYQLGFGVDYTYVKDGYIYAASAERGLYRGRMTDNLLDPGNWQRTGEYTPMQEDRTNVADPATGYQWTRTQQGKLACYTTDSEGNRTYKTEGVLPEGPASNNFYRLYMHGGKLYAVGGNYSRVLDGGYPGEVHVWDGTAWSEFEQVPRETTGHKNVDYISMDFDPKREGHTMIGAKSGLYEYQDGKLVKCHDRSNSPLQSCVDNDNYLLISDVKYDSDGKLWVFNSSVDNSLLTLGADGEWTVQPVSANIKSSGNAFLENFIATDNGTRLWFSKREWESPRIYVYDVARNQFGAYGPSYINEDGTTVAPNDQYSLATDRDGNIWACTSSGPFYFNPNDFLAGNNTVTQHKVPRNDGTNLADYLLTNTPTRCMAVDGANRKWFGTTSGVFLVSDDCNTQLQHFTADNSPLLANEVYSIAIDPNSSTVYFATEAGLCSYESDATQPSEQMTKDNVYAYPNPVTPDYTGMITIVGLSYKADVKIMTANGTLVNQGTSNGGSYQWDGRDLKGRRVASGVYMVAAATQDGGKGTVCKIAIIN